MALSRSPLVLIALCLVVSTISTKTDDLVDVSLYSSAIIDAPIEQIWPVQSNFTHMHLWYHQFSTIKIFHGDGVKVGSKRECIVGTNTGKVIREELVAFDAHHHTYSYSVLPYENESENPLPFSLTDHRADVELFPLNCDATTGASTFVLWSIRFKTSKDKAALAKAVNEKVFGVLFTQLAAYFNGNRLQTPTSQFSRSVRTLKGKTHTSFGCAFQTSPENLYRELNGKTSMAIDFTPTPELLQVKPQALSKRRIYHFRDAFSAGYRFDLQEDTLEASATDLTTTTSLDLSSASLPQLRTVHNHKSFRKVYPVVFQIPAASQFGNLTTTYQSVVVFKDEFETDKTEAQSEAVEFLGWFSNSISSHVAKVLSTPADTTFGKMITRVFTSVFAVSSDILWTAFDDYIGVQKIFSGHDDLTVDPNDPTIISFTQPGFSEPTVEKLTIKHNTPPVRTWQIILPVPNAIFSQYTATVTFADSVDKNNRPTTHATFVLEVTFKSDKLETRTQFITMTEYYLTIRLQQIAAHVARTKGVQHAFEPFILDYSPAQFYKTLTTWSDVTWVQTALGCQINSLGLTRWVNWPNGVLMRESMIDHNDKDQTLTYMVEPSDNMGCALYAGDIRIEPIEGGKKSKVSYVSNILVLHDLPTEAVVDKIVKIFLGRFAWLEQTFTGASKQEKKTEL
eukprot:TRINITY_DN1076_c0_g1_i2.p1 TRINITY_DN1076_c0_g1~~TRINITY_DN1076_c0_g1_i2.p1  ORF type:complete len:699 (-),score=183.13 TRINITY_DN1076_c0_g1_i2:113-2152(-)